MRHGGCPDVLLTTEKFLAGGDDNIQREAGRRERECPRCESRSIAHSRIRGAVGHAAMRLLRLRPYRCLDCWHRFLGVSRQA